MSTDDTTAASGFKAEVEQRVDAAKASVERAKRTVEEVKEEVSTAVDDRRGGPATSVEDAQAKAEQLRAGIARDLAALQARVPDREAVTGQVRQTAAVAGGVAAGVAGLAFVLGRRRSRRAEEKQLRRQAEVLADVLARAEEVAEADDDRSWTWLALLVGAAAAGTGAVLWQRHRQDDLDVEDLWGPEPA
ncbi:MAG: hypothetical protein ACNA8R_00920 [Nitriliruptoraceae bacterium]